jgi:hypothetical protein
VRHGLAQLQSDGIGFGAQCAAMLSKSSALASASKQMSLALHEFATSIVGLTSLPPQPVSANESSLPGGEALGNLSGPEREALLDTADAMNVLAASMQNMEEGLRLQFGGLLQQICTLATTTYSSAVAEASDARLELESEGKRTATQMSKKHQEAARRPSDVAFGDLLKIQQSLKAVEKRFEGAATTQLSTLLRLRAMRHELVGNLLEVQREFEATFTSSAKRLAALTKNTHVLVNRHLPKFSENWDLETSQRESLISKSVGDSYNGTISHMEGYLVASAPVPAGVGGPSGSKARKYFVVSDGSLTQYPGWNVYEPEMSWDLLLFTCRATDGHPRDFEVQSPMVSVYFEAPTEAKKTKWLAVLAENIRIRLDSHNGLSGSDDGSKGRSPSASAAEDAKKQEILLAIRGIAGIQGCHRCRNYCLG